MWWWRCSWWWRLRGRGAWGPFGPAGRSARWLLVLAGIGLWICLRILGAVWSLFQHAYLGSYFYIPGSQVDRVYWSSVYFALGATVLVVLLAAVLAGVAALEVARLRRRW